MSLIATRALVDAFAILAPVARQSGDQPHGLHEVDGRSSPTVENVPATSQNGAIEGYRTSAVFENAVDQRAANETRIVYNQRFALDRAVLDRGEQVRLLLLSHVLATNRPISRLADNASGDGRIRDTEAQSFRKSLL